MRRLVVTMSKRLDLPKVCSKKAWEALEGRYPEVAWRGIVGRHEEPTRVYLPLWEEVGGWTGKEEE